MGVFIVGQLSPWLRRRRRWLRGLFALAVVGGVATGSPGAASAVPATGYVNPLRAAQGLVAERIDQGVDYAAAGGSPIYALGNGIVTNLYNSGWPNGVFLVYQLTSGPAQGWPVFVAEDVTPAVTVGQQVTSSTVLARFEAGADGGYDIEMGWADPCSCGQPLASTYGQYPADGDATAFGRNFDDLMTTLGAPAGSIQGPETGSLPVGWPVWTALNPVQDVFFAGGQGHLYESAFGSSGWHGGFDMCRRHSWGCTPSSAAGVAVDPATEQQYVFWRGARGDIFEAFHRSGAWHGPINMCTSKGWGCAVMAGAPQVGVGEDGSQYVLYRGGNGHIFEAIHRSGAWHGGSDMCRRHSWGCTPSSAAAVAVNPATDQQYVFWRGARGDIFEAFHRSGAWHGPINMCTSKGWGCAVMAGAPQVGVGEDGSQYVLYRGGNGHIFEAIHRSGAWHGGFDMCRRHSWGCTPSSAPGLAVNPATDQQYVFWRGARGDIFEAFHRSGAWHGPINMCTSKGWGCKVASVVPSVAVSASAIPPPAETLAPPVTHSPHTSTSPVTRSKATSKASRKGPPASSSSAPKAASSSSEPPKGPPKTSRSARPPSPSPASPTPSRSSSSPREPSPTPSAPSSTASPTPAANSGSSSTPASAQPSPPSSSASGSVPKAPARYSSAG